jgi:hypothetical protein
MWPPGSSTREVRGWPVPGRAVVDEHELPAVAAVRSGPQEANDGPALRYGLTPGTGGGYEIYL